MLIFGNFVGKNKRLATSYYPHMAKIVSLNSSQKTPKEVKKALYDKFRKRDYSPEVLKLLDTLGIKTPDQLMGLLELFGIDENKFFKKYASVDSYDDIKYEDVMFDEDDPRSNLFSTALGGFPFIGDWEDEEDEDEWFDEDEDEREEELSYFPEKMYLETGSVREYHIRVKLNNSPVNIWRELKVPSNMSLELLAHVLITAMGWEDEHLHQFSVKGFHGRTIYKPASELREEDSFMLLESSADSADDTPLSYVLCKDGKRIQFEYDFGDGWTHDVWVKGVRDYALGETPEVILLKGKGHCPPEDCGGVWGYTELLDLLDKKRLTADEKGQLEWFDMTRGVYDPNEFDIEEYAQYLKYYLFEAEEDMAERAREAKKKKR